MRKYCRVRQRDLTDCGAACLASVFAHYGLHVPVARIRQWADTDQSGTSVYGLLQAAKKVNMEAKAVKATSCSLPSVSFPAIAHVIVQESITHFVVIDSMRASEVTVMDPAEGHFRKMSLQAFSEVWTGVLLILVPGEGFQTNRKSSNRKKISALIRPYRTSLFIAMLCSIGFSIIGITGTMYLRQVVDGVLETEETAMLAFLSLAMIFMLVLQYLTGLLKGYLVLRTSQSIDGKLVLGYYHHLLHLPQKFFDTMRTGEMVSRINDATMINSFVNEVVMNAVVDVMILISSIVLMFVYYWKLAIVMLLIVPVYGLLFYLSNLVNKKWQRRIMEEGATLESLLVQTLTAASTIKKLAIEQHIYEKVRIKYVRLLQMVRHSAWRHTSIHVSADFITRIFTVLVLWAGCYFVFAKNLTKGELLAFYALISYFTSPVLSLLSVNKNVRDALIAADRLFEVMEMEKEEADGGYANFSNAFSPLAGLHAERQKYPPLAELRAERQKYPPLAGLRAERQKYPPLAGLRAKRRKYLPLAELRAEWQKYPPLAGVARSAGGGPGDIEFRNVSFRYGNGKIILDEMNLFIPKGSCIGIKGESGSGKSTLAALLLKLYQPLQGTISINNIDLSMINNKALRSLVVSVPQFTELFNGTVRENIILDKTCDEEKLNSITSRLGVLNFFENDSQGLETVIYEQGTNLSGGQRQLVSIARALYRDPPVLILDEPSASLDAETENKIMQTIEWYNKQGNTVIIISHSDAALKICNNIVVLKNGKIV